MYIQIGREALACRSSVAVFSTSSMGKLVLSGPDVDETARSLFTRDVTSGNNRAFYTLILDEQGGIESDLVVTSMQDEKGEGNLNLENVCWTFHVYDTTGV